VGGQRPLREEELEVVSRRRRGGMPNGRERKRERERERERDNFSD